LEKIEVFDELQRSLFEIQISEKPTPKKATTDIDQSNHDQKDKKWNGQPLLVVVNSFIGGRNRVFIAPGRTEISHQLREMNIQYCCPELTFLLPLPLVFSSV
tara:strand:- start:2099 stop:2404 length:306 start_codon:yes stop_codon:yes gene_type:complete